MTVVPYPREAIEEAFNTAYSFWGSLQYMTWFGWFSCGILVFGVVFVVLAVLLWIAGDQGLSAVTLGFVGIFLAVLGYFTFVPDGADGVRKSVAVEIVQEWAEQQYGILLSTEQAQSLDDRGFDDETYSYFLRKDDTGVERLARIPRSNTPEFITPLTTPKEQTHE